MSAAGTALSVRATRRFLLGHMKWGPLSLTTQQQPLGRKVWNSI